MVCSVFSFKMDNSDINYPAEINLEIFNFIFVDAPIDFFI